LLWSCGRAEPLPQLLFSPPVFEEPLLPARVPMASVPDEPQSRTPAEELELRLAALAVDFERRRDQAGLPGLIEFDVQGLATELNELLERYKDRASISVHVRDLETGHVLFDYFGDSPLIPASNQKIVTSAAALDLLGPEYVFITRVQREGPTLYLAGEGDPLLQVDDLVALAELTLEAVDVPGLQKLVVDDTVFSPRHFGPGYGEDGVGHSYQAPSGALSLAFNTVRITVFEIAGSSRLGVSVFPECAHLRVDNRARRGTRSTLMVRTYAEGEKTVVHVRGRLAKGDGPLVVRRRITDPALFTGTTFAAILADLSTSERLRVERGRVPASAETVVVNESLPLIEVLESGLAYSNNFIAEQTLRTLAWRTTGDPGDWDAGQEILHDYWEALTGPQPAVVVNASGFSREGRLTTQGLVDLIEVAHRSAPPGGNLIDALPVAGESGTMRSRLRLSGKRVRAKTGTLDRVSGLSGVITSEAGEPLVGFSILSNVEPGVTFVAESRRALEERIVMRVLAALDDYEAQRVGLVAPRGESR